MFLRSVVLLLTPGKKKTSEYFHNVATKTASRNKKSGKEL